MEKMDFKKCISDYIKAYEEYINDKSDLSTKNLQETSDLLDKFYPEFTKDTPCYKTLYHECKQFMKQFEKN